MESSGPPTRTPRTFPHPSEILSVLPPSTEDYRSSHSRDDGEAIYPLGSGGGKTKSPPYLPRLAS
jgi:hypothetical protein